MHPYLLYQLFWKSPIVYLSIKYSVFSMNQLLTVFSGKISSPIPEDWKSRTFEASRTKETLIHLLRQTRTLWDRKGLEFVLGKKSVTLTINHLVFSENPWWKKGEVIPKKQDIAICLHLSYLSGFSRHNNSPTHSPTPNLMPLIKLDSISPNM